MLNMIHYDIDGVDFEPGIKYHNIDRIDFGKKNIILTILGYGMRL